MCDSCNQRSIPAAFHISSNLLNKPLSPRLSPTSQKQAAFVSYFSRFIAKWVLLQLLYDACNLLFCHDTNTSVFILFHNVLLILAM